jgi:4-amino-4-deoxy-L-arabinose transferase-like glycosyltransferase
MLNNSEETGHCGTVRSLATPSSAIAFSTLASASLAAFVAGACFLLVWFTTSGMGVGLSPDSADYLSIASSMQRTLTLKNYSGEADSHYPPGYSAMLAGTSAITFRDVRHGAPRLVAAASFCVLGLVTFLLVRFQTRADVGGLLAVFALASHQPTLYWASSAMSEIPFLSLTAIAVYVAMHANTLRREWMLYLSGVILSAACMTRYVGIVWPFVFATFFFVSQKYLSIRIRFRRLFLFLVISFWPLLTWFIYWQLTEEGRPARTFQWHPIDFARLSAAVLELTRCVGFADSTSGALLLGMIALTVALGLCRSQFIVQSGTLGTCGAKWLSLEVLLMACATAYLAFLVTSISLFDRATPLDGRILIPVSWMLITLAAIGITWVLRSHYRLGMVFSVGFSLLMCGRFLYEVLPDAAAWHSEGIDLSRPVILYDKALGWVRDECPKDKHLYSNTAWSVYLATRRDVKLLQGKEDYTTGVPNKMYSESLTRLVEDVLSSRAVVVMDRLYQDRHFLPPTVNEIESLGLVADAELSTERFLIFR